MRVVRGLAQLKRPLRRPVVTIGNFDGVHLGHQAIFERVMARARETRGTGVVITFDPHPAKALGHKPIRLLTTPQEKLRLLAQAGLDATLVFPFTPALAALSPEDFVRKVLVKKLGVAWVCVGHDYAFGRGRAGTIADLKALGREYGFGVEVVSAVKVGRVVASSSAIRGLLLEGKVEQAARLLGRAYSIEGRVIHGANRGKALGFPTANLSTPNELVPRDGVYVVQARVGRRVLSGVANLGTDPTFGGGRMCYEVHLLDFQGRLYGRPIRMVFLKRLRDERTFPDAGALQAQIRRDVARARTFFRTVGS